MKAPLASCRPPRRHASSEKVARVKPFALAMFALFALFALPACGEAIDAVPIRCMEEAEDDVTVEDWIEIAAAGGIPERRAIAMWDDGADVTARGFHWATCMERSGFTCTPSAGPLNPPERCSGSTVGATTTLTSDNPFITP